MFPPEEKPKPYPCVNGTIFFEFEPVTQGSRYKERLVFDFDEPEKALKKFQDLLAEFHQPKT